MAKKKILFVDDEKDLGDLYAAFFEHHGLDFIVAYSVTEALSLLKKEGAGIHLVISDYHVGDNGEGANILCTYVKNLPPKEAPKMFLFSGFSPQEIEEKGGTYGFELVRKPVSPKSLLQKVLSYLSVT